MYVLKHNVKCASTVTWACLKQNKVQNKAYSLSTEFELPSEFW